MKSASSTKLCRGCRLELGPEGFAKSSYTQQPYHRCRACRTLEYKKRLAAMPEEKYRAMKENELAWRRRNPERVSEYNRKVCEKRKLERRAV